jgi:hypothetical protein
MNSFDIFIKQYDHHSLSFPKLPDEIPTEKNVSDIINIFCKNGFGEYNRHTNNKYECILKLIKHVSPSNASVTKFLMRIKKNSTYYNKQLEKSYEIINYLYFNRGFKFNQTQLNLLETINYYIDVEKVIKNNQKICDKMFRFCFNIKKEKIIIDVNTHYYLILMILILQNILIFS